MSRIKRLIAKTEADPTQRKMTDYFPKSENWQHDFTISIQKKKTHDRLLVSKIVATIDLNSSDDEFQASNLSRTASKSKYPESEDFPKVRKCRKKHDPDSQTNNNNAVNQDFIQIHLQPDILQNTLHKVKKQEESAIVNDRESVSDDLKLHNINFPSYSKHEESFVAQINNADNSVACNFDLIKKIPLPQLNIISRSTRNDTVYINKSKLLINCPENSKSIILQTNTIDLFSVNDDVEQPEYQINNTIRQSQEVFDQCEDAFPGNYEKADLYPENVVCSNKENSPEICNTVMPNQVANYDYLPKCQPLSSQMNNSVDITIAPSFDLDESDAIDTTLIRDYVNRNNNESIHDVLVELHNALDRMENTEAIDPESPYYKMFFLRKVIRNVVENFDMLGLLRDVERRTLVKFLQMDTKYQYFCYRLFTRLPKWYNMYKLIENMKLNMNEKDVSDMYSCLQENNFIQTDYSKESISTLLHLLERNALMRIHSNFKIKKAKYNKEDIIDSLIAFCNSQTTLSANYRPDQILYKLISVEMGPCAKLENNFYTTLCRVHLLNSFTNFELVKISDLYYFLLQIERGDIILPSYDVENAVSNIFPKRQDFLLYSKAAEYKSQFVLKMEKTGKKRDWKSIKHICDCAYLELQIYVQNNAFQKNSKLMNRFTAGHKYASILSEASKHLTKMYTDEVEKWLSLLLQQYLFCQKLRGLWYDRLALINSTYKKNVDKAAEIVLQGLNDPFVSESGRREILNRGISLMKRKTCKVREDLKNTLKERIPIPLEKKYSIRNIQGKQQQGNQGKCYILERDGQHHTYYSVEEYSIKHYITEVNFTDGVHCEGALFTTLFTTLFWDIIYDEYTAGTFINNMQVYPLDYFSKEFYTNREDAIEGRLEQITQVWSEEHFIGTIRNNFEQHKNKRCGISTNLFQSGEQLVTIAKCIGRESLAVVMKRMALHLGDMCAGLPDLFVWNSVTNKCKFVEVKSEKDRLSMKQILWLNFLISANLDAEVCNVLPSIKTSNVPALKRATIE